MQTLGMCGLQHLAVILYVLYKKVLTPKLATRYLTFYLGNGTAPAGLYLKDNSVWVAEITTQKIIEFNIDRENGVVTGINKSKGNSNK
ncbi:hypothetical protein DYY67_0323 [Candidatus Nitrosotalea sp. TS]|uniref:hypothetical protein n=1 Tax=Candidatus Nitrosotalea sp. TS TaxID=2341020 RepID=UPI001C49992E|nr:hypothetical protein [Candidatus Nitrosotalea sp. TS]NHI04565.1 hypothetical protein [Candidatus Nitrosotalea sp. TS]